MPNELKAFIFIGIHMLTIYLKLIGYAYLSIYYKKPAFYKVYKAYIKKLRIFKKKFDKPKINRVNFLIICI